MTRKQIILLAAIIIGAFLFIILGIIILIAVINGTRTSPTVTSFDECAQYYPVMESYPRQCTTPDGQQFVEELTCANAGAMCGGITGMACCNSLICDYDSTYPDASGKCVLESSSSSITSSAGIANPASEYCVEQGGTLQIREDVNGGQYGVCILPSGTECEEWAFYNGNCS
jgi:putative hemolysin